jgi:catechol 2,3-dioxygenase-like lactoylglutathione lyase family enzyme
MPSPLGYDGGLTAGLSVRDLDESLAWYVDVLGFSMNYKLDEMGWAELQTEVAGVTVGLSQVEDVPTGGGATLTFGVRDIEAARALLEQRDVRFDGETQVIPGMVKFATFYDPDGNVLMLFEDLSGGA